MSKETSREVSVSYFWTFFYAFTILLVAFAISSLFGFYTQDVSVFSYFGAVFAIFIVAIHWLRLV